MFGMQLHSLLLPLRALASSGTARTAPSGLVGCVWQIWNSVTCLPRGLGKLLRMYVTMATAVRGRVVGLQAGL